MSTSSRALLGGRCELVQDGGDIRSASRPTPGSTDLTGEGRRQVMDRNWQVCTSTPAPGESLTADTTVDFGVVRVDNESCP